MVPGMSDVPNLRSRPLCRPSPAERPCEPESAKPLQAVLGLQLRRLRNERGLTRKRVAASLNISPRRVEAHERGIRPFAAEELVAYACLFDVRISSFFRDVATEERPPSRLCRVQS
jgi:DNA-binding XRE family transcriptional regulator